jgi:hypothetical protein
MANPSNLAAALRYNEEQEKLRLAMADPMRAAYGAQERATQARLPYMKELATKFGSLDNQDMTMGETVADIGMGFVPGIGQAQSVRDFERSRRDDDYLGMGLSAAGMIPIAGGLAKVVSATRKGSDLAEALKKTSGLVAEVKTRLGTQYPAQLPGVEKIDPKTGNVFIGKNKSNEELLVQKARNIAQKDIDKGNYTPFFNVDERYYVDPKNYPLVGRTIEDVMPKKQATINKYTERFDTPEARTRLDEAYKAGKDDPRAHNWYAMGQLEKAFTDELGIEEGRRAFKERIADAMAATTAGSDPQSNLLMAGYANFMKEAGRKLPEGAYDMPHPIGGRYATMNTEMYDKVINQGQGLSTKNPKRFNFSSNFMGHLDRPTIDEQMTKIIDPNEMAPPGESYGIMEKMINQAAERAGLGDKSVNFQDVAWKGTKGVPGKPMMEHVNEAIERTVRITGKTPQQVLKDFIRAKAPLFGFALPVVGGSMLMNRDNEDGA